MHFSFLPYWKPQEGFDTRDIQRRITRETYILVVCFFGSLAGAVQGFLATLSGILLILLLLLLMMMMMVIMMMMMMMMGSVNLMDYTLDLLIEQIPHDDDDDDSDDDA